MTLTRSAAIPQITLDPTPANLAATVTIADNDSATVSITANDASASETATDNGQFTVSLTKVSSTDTWSPTPSAAPPRRPPTTPR